MKKLFFIPLVLLGLFILLALPIYAFTSDNFKSLADAYLEKNCESKIPKDLTIGSICYLLYKDKEFQMPEIPKTLMVKDAQEKILGPFIKRDTHDLFILADLGNNLQLVVDMETEFGKIKYDISPVYFTEESCTGDAYMMLDLYNISTNDLIASFGSNYYRLGDNNIVENVPVKSKSTCDMWGNYNCELYDYLINAPKLIPLTDDEKVKLLPFEDAKTPLKIVTR